MNVGSKCFLQGHNDALRRNRTKDRQRYGCQLALQCTLWCYPTGWNISVKCLSKGQNSVLCPVWASNLRLSFGALTDLRYAAAQT